MTSALFWVIMQRMVVIFTDVSGNLSVPPSRVRKSKKIKTLEDRTDRLSRNVDKIYHSTLRNILEERIPQDIGFERRNTISSCMENPLWKRLWTFRRTD
jgi:hypothetical protein